LRLVRTRSRLVARTAAMVSGSRISSAISTPTTEAGSPAARTPSSIVGDSTLGSTRVSVASVATVAKAAPVPSLLNTATRCRREPASRQTPTIPLQAIITAASIAPARNTATNATTAPGGLRPHVPASTSRAATGRTRLHREAQPRTRSIMLTSLAAPARSRLP
jgi:hypothetical protein